MGLILDLAFRYMGEGGAEAAKETGKTPSCRDIFLCEEPKFVCPTNFGLAVAQCPQQFAGNDCMWRGEYCAYGCEDPDFDCSSHIWISPLPCTPTYACIPGPFTCGASEQDIFLCDAGFGGCGNNAVHCKGKYNQCQDTVCLVVNGRPFNCDNFNCGAADESHPFQCAGEVWHKFGCGAKGGIFGCQLTYNCINTAYEFDCTEEHMCADKHNCEEVPFSCDRFICGTGEIEDAFTCEVTSGAFNEDCGSFLCNNFDD